MITDVVSTAEFPGGDPTGPEIKSWVQQSIAQFGARNEFPRWTLPEPIDEAPASLRMRRAALLFLHALPGTVYLDPAAERELQGAEAPAPFDVDEVLRRAGEEPSHLAGGRGAHPGQDVHWQDYYQRYGLNDVLIFSGSRSDWGSMTIANFGREACPVTDGMICVASDRPYGGLDPTSDNDLLPPLTTIWLASK